MRPRLREVSGAVNYRIASVTFRVVRDGALACASRPVMNGPDAVVGAIRSADLIPDDAREHFLALYLDSQNRLVATHEVSIGTLSSSLVHPREVFGPALRLLGVASIILVHNHPSGDPEPSREDVRLSRQLVEVGKEFDLPVHDHVILGDGSDAYASLATRGLI